MANADDVLAEALCRLEFKLDLVLKGLNIMTPPPMNSPYSRSCPVCSTPVDYQVDLAKQVVVRKCACGTGKIPPSIPLFQDPISQMQKQVSQPGVGNVRSDED